ILISVALLFLIIELSYINAKSLIYLNNATEALDQAFAVIGSIAFSVVTILVMMNSVVKWPKYLFPVFDTGLMFLGLNLTHYDTLLDNPIRLALTFFMASFTGIITFSLGLIEFKSFKSDSKVKETELKERLNSLGLRYDSVKSELKSLKSVNSDTMEQLQNSKREIKSLKSQLESKQTDIEKMMDVYLKAEVSRIKKKSEANRTEEEKQLLKEAA
ncbi:hypothetical protein, partial [Saccharicrinis fermentans]|uniref:hypothetical protein n=2 Tax=Saccharicrinis fermentans TaxID=982 RepID=UPI00138AF354